MIDSIFDSRTLKKFDSLAQKQAKLDDQKKCLVKNTMESLDPQTIQSVLQTVKQYGHPNERKKSEAIEKKYLSGQDLEFDDLKNLDSLYKSNISNFSKAGDDDG